MVGVCIVVLAKVSAILEMEDICRFLRLDSVLGRPLLRTDVGVRMLKVVGEKTERVELSPSTDISEKFSSELLLLIETRV